MNILVSCDEKYAAYLPVMLKSLFIHHKGIKITVYLLYEEISVHTLRQLEAFTKKHHAQLISISMRAEYGLERFPVTIHLSTATYYRCFASELLPKALERVLYLDIDTIVMKNLMPLYSCDFEDHIFIASQEHSREVCEERKRALDIPQERGYICAGIMLINLHKLRSVFDVKRISSWLEKYAHQIQFCDQDLLNGMFYDAMIVLRHEQYNYWASRKEDTQSIPKEVAIIHYGGSSKPWENGYAGKFGSVWWKYALMANFGRWGGKCMSYSCFKVYWHLKQMNPALAGAVKGMVKKITN